MFLPQNKHDSNQQQLTQFMCTEEEGEKKSPWFGWDSGWKAMSYTGSGANGWKVNLKMNL